MTKDNLFAISLFPYLGFLWFMTRSRQTPPLALIGFYVLLVFVFVTIPAGIYAQVHYGKSLANVDWLHGSAEFFLTLSNILVVLGFRQAVIEKKQVSEGDLKSD
jgi:heme A synthase